MPILIPNLPPICYMAAYADILIAVANNGDVYRFDMNEFKYRSLAEKKSHDSFIKLPIKLFPSQFYQDYVEIEPAKNNTTKLQSMQRL